MTSFRCANEPVKPPVCLFSIEWLDLYSAVARKDEKRKCFKLMQFIFSLMFAVFTVLGFDGHYRQTERRNSQEWQVS